MNIRKGVSALVAVALIGTCSVMTTACERNKGPVEKAGEKIDKAVDKVSDKVDPKGPAEKAGRALDRATDN